MYNYAERRGDREMEVVKQTVTISTGREVVIQLPDSAEPDQEAEVIVIFSPASNGSRMAQMDKAMSDPLYLEDLEEVRRDFAHVDLDEVVG